MANLKKNVIIICVEGCRADRAVNSKIFLNENPGRVFF